MRLLNRLAAGLKALVRRRRQEADLDAELREFLQASTDAKTAAGMTPEDAARAARIELGSPAAVKDWVADVGWETRIESVWHDVRYAGRMLKRTPAFSAAAVVTFALGIGITLAMFTLADGMLFRPLPYQQPEQLVMIQGYDARTGRAYNRVDRVDFDQLQAEHSGLAGIATAATDTSLTRIGADGAESFSTWYGTPNLLDLLGVGAHIGRPLRPGDEAGEPRAAMLTFKAWERRFGADPRIVGQTLAFDQGSLHIVGVLPRSFLSPIQGASARGDILLTRALDPKGAGNPRAGVWSPVARLRPGVSLAQAQSEVDLLVRRAAQQYSETNQNRALRVVGLQFGLFELNRSMLWLLVSAAGGVLLIACVNLASLLTARGSTREREIGIRTAIGASRARIARQLIVESMVLGLIACAATLLVAMAVFEVAVTYVPARFQLPPLAFDARTTTFTVLLSVVASIVFGALPALRSSSAAPGISIGQRRTVLRRPWFRPGAALVAAEVALCLILLAGTGLTANSLLRMRSVDLGFHHTDVVELSFVPPTSRYPRQRAYDLQMEVLNEIRRLPGVQAAAIDVPQVGGAMPMRLRKGPDKSGIWSITPGYFSTMGMEVIAGRDFADTDAPPHNRVAVLSESTSRALWPEEGAVGRALAVDDKRSVTVIGVVRDIRASYRGPTKPAIYLLATREDYRWLEIVARGKDPAALGTAMRTIVQRIDPGIVVPTPRTIAATLSVGIEDSSFQTWLFAAFGLVALLVSAAGIYGTVSYWVGSRMQELGVRVALGAQPRRVKTLVLREACVPLLIGVALGLIGAFICTRRLQSLLFGITPTDPATIAGVVLVLMSVGMIAAYVPARRAARVDPLIVLKAE